MKNQKIVYIVHCVDTEGPLYESLQVTSERIYKIFGLKYDLNRKLLSRLRKGLDIPDDLKESVMDFVSKQRLNYKTDWSEIDEMLGELLSHNWRQKYADDDGRGYIFSWFIIDHVGFQINPRRRAIGYHAIFDHYLDKIKTYQHSEDRLYWHFHPVSFFFEAHKTSNNISFTNHHLQVLSRRVIDHLYFPAAFRPGSHCERPDINLFLEQWIPFDYGNQGMKEREADEIQKDVSGGRFGDWRFATDQWEVYHPDFYDYQKSGGMKRYIARCLNLESRIRPITEEEIEKAFIRADSDKPTILSVTNHDEREMRPAIDWFMSTIRAVQKKYPQVKICHSNAVDAIRRVEGLDFEAPSQLSYSWNKDKIEISADKSIWGPQPFFCFKTKDMRYIHENLDFQGEKHWSYVFDEDTITLDKIEAIGVATNDNYGNTSVYRLTPDKDLTKTETRFMNLSSIDESLNFASMRNESN